MFRYLEAQHSDFLSHSQTSQSVNLIGRGKDSIGRHINLYFRGPETYIGSGLLFD